MVCGGIHRIFSGNRLLLPVLAGCVIGLAGCQSGGSAGEAAAPADGAPARPTISQAELDAFCPPVAVRQGTASYNSYARGGQGDPAKISYQASISAASRACSRADGMLTITVAVAGRVVPGPAGAPSAVTLPIRVAVTRGDEVLYSQMIKDQVNVTSANAATQYMVRDSNVVIPVPDRRNVRVQVGFDDAVAAAGSQQQE